MQIHHANAILNNVAGARAIPAIRITSHNMRGGIRA
jgi:hypothetical protein